GNRIRNLGAPATAIVPTPANIAGDFSDRLSATSPGNPLHKVEVIGDPLSPTGSPFPGNIIPNSRFDPATVKMLTFLPQGSGNGSIVNVKPISQNFYDIVTKVDHSIGANDKFAGRYYG